MMQEHQPHPDAAREIRRLDQQADHLDYVGQHDAAEALRLSAGALLEAEVQRLAALEDARLHCERLTLQLRDAWEAIDPRDSFAWFVEHSDDQGVIELRLELRRQQSRMLILDAAKA